MVLVLLLILVSLPFLCSANDKTFTRDISNPVLSDDEVMQLDTVPVTAKEGKPTWFEAPRAVTRIETEMIKQRAPGTLPDALRGETGIVIQETTPGQGTPIIRGLLGSSTVIVVDGMRLNTSIFRPAPNQYFSLVDPYNVEQIDIIRGASPTLFGNGAIGGVVSVRTPVPQFDTEDWTWNGTLHGIFRSADVSPMTRLAVRGGFHGLGLSGGVTYQHHGDLRGGGEIGRQRPSDYEVFAGDGKVFIGDEYQNFLLNMQFLEQPDTPRFDQLRAGFGQDQPDASEFVFEPNNRLFIHGRYVHNLSFFFIDRLEANLSFQEINDDRRIRDFATEVRDREENRNRVWEFNMHGLSGWKEGAVFRYGIQVLRDEVRSRRRQQDLASGSASSVPGRFANHASLTSGAAYLQTIIHLSSLWELTVGGRWSHVDIEIPKADRAVGTHVSVSEVTGDVGTVFHLTPTVNLVAHIGRAFRAPNIFDLSTLGARPGNRFNVPNTGLKAETAWSFDGGIKLETPQFAGEFVGFLIRVDDKIESIPTGETTADGRVVVRNDNLNTVTLVGFETGWAWLWSERGELFGNLTFTWGEEKTRSGRTHPADRIPPLNGRLGGAYQFTPRFRLESFVRFANRQDRLSPRDRSDPRIQPDGTPGWVTVNFRSSYLFRPGLTGRLSLLNALDQPYREHGSGIAAAGINLIISAEATF